jgi:hypothetical protein
VTITARGGLGGKTAYKEASKELVAVTVYNAAHREFWRGNGYWRGTKGTPRRDFCGSRGMRGIFLHSRSNRCGSRGIFEFCQSES